MIVSLADLGKLQALFRPRQTTSRVRITRETKLSGLTIDPFPCHATEK